MAINLILASHGLFAQEALKSAEMILGGGQEGVAVVSVTEGRTYDECLAELQELYEKNKGIKETLILVDIYGGTPANIATYLDLSYQGIQVYSGLNLPLLLELFLSKPKNLAVAKKIVEAVQEVSLVDISSKAREGMIDNGNSMDSY